jgi:LacI family transcriptional regulator
MRKSVSRRSRARGRQATLKDVADSAAVSMASASRALTRPEAVSDSLREKVLATVAALGYVCNGAARSLARRRSGWIGVVADEFDGPAAATALAALERRLADAGWAVLLATVAGEPSPLDVARALAGRGVEALAFLGVTVPEGLAQLPSLERLPCVSVDRADDGPDATGLDWGRAGTLATDYLSSLGHQRIALVAEAHAGFDHRLRVSVRAECASTGIELELLDPAEESLSDRIAGWSATPSAPTAVICTSDALAIAVMLACFRAGIAIPGSLSIVGIGDTPLSRRVSPMLTSIRIPGAAAGLAAAEYLLAQLGGAGFKPAQLSIKLAVRGTTGPAPVR